MIVQPKLEMPAKIAAGIASGKFVLIGGVVRNAHGGTIVTFLKDAPSAESSQEAVGRVAAMLRRRGTVAAAALGALAGGATALALTKKRKSTEKRKASECVVNLDASLRRYLDAGRERSLDADIVDRLISDLNATKAYSDSAGVVIDFSTELWETLVNLVADHTQKLAEAYSVELNELQGQTLNTDNDNVINLRRHLEVQRRILTRAA